MVSIISVSYDNAKTIWITSLVDESDIHPESYTLVTFRNLNPNVQLCRGDMRGIRDMPCTWILV